jgi:hypothetical protein
MENCCQADCRCKKSFWSGIVYGLVPHTFCIAFFVLSLVGATLSAAVVKKFLLLPYFFLILTILSLLFATLAAFFYLKNNQCCSAKGIRKKYKYLIVLYATTVTTNILMAYIIIPVFINKQSTIPVNQNVQLAITNIEVQIPCPGHAPLIIDEVRKVSGVENVSFKMPRTFEIAYNSQKTSLENITNLEIFKTFKIKYN